MRALWLVGTVLSVLVPLAAGGCGAAEQLFTSDSCEIDGRVYPHGAQNIPKGDGCNTCDCRRGVAQCTTVGCAPSPNPTGTNPQPNPTSNPTSPIPTTNPTTPAPIPRSCGGTLNTTCGTGEYCEIPDRACAAVGTCRPRPNGCGDIYSPVCGCDGRSYENRCSANRAGTGVAAFGDCPGGCLVDGEWYPNGAAFTIDCAPCRCEQGVVGCASIDCEPGCWLDGVHYPEGTSSIPAGDGCNTCSCLEGELTCTRRSCSFPPSSCVINGKVYEAGSRDVPDPASCNTCECREGKIVGCTLAGCPLPPPCVEGRAIYQHGFGYVAADGSTQCLCDSGKMVCSPVP